MYVNAIETEKKIPNLITQAVSFLFVFSTVGSSKHLRSIKHTRYILYIYKKTSN